MIASWTHQRRPVALVTGASRGIGAAIARDLHALGLDLVVVGRSAETLESLGASLPRSESMFMVLAADLSEPAGIDALSADLPPVDVLINCAGAIHGADGWRQEKRDDITRSFELHYTAVLQLAQVVVPNMVEGQWGRIISLTSIYGLLGSPYVASYSASKAALLSLTRSLAVDLGPQGVTVNSISPGNIDTEMTMSAGSDYIRDVVRRTPVGRLGRVDEVARTVQFLIESPFVNGADIVIDGGLSLVGG
jgi:3-oxoacyl-[acyl-carrier protein] reductase